MRSRFCFPLAVLIGLLTFSAIAQEKSEVRADDRYSAPIEWRRYRVSAAETSFLMPKVPVKDDLTFACAEKRGVTYHAYANQSVYEFRFYEKEPKKGISSCREVEPFSAALEARLNEVRGTDKTRPYSEVDSDINGRKVKIFRIESENYNTTRWVFTADSESRWIEIAVYHSTGVRPESEKFLNSLGSGNLDSIEINSGAVSFLGDAGSMPSPVTEAGKEPVKQPLVLFSKPKPPYTDMARKNDVQGNVTLKVTFLANGGIGEITVESGLKYGLTEQAIAAARRMAFIPPRENGVPVTTVRKVNYGFNIF